MNRALRRTALVLLSLGGALVAANAALARWFPLPVRMYRTDPELIYRPIPGARSVKSAGPEGARRWVTTQIDAQGYRGRDLAVPKHGPRIAVYGDSFAFAEDVPLEETFVERLGAACPGAPEMVNAGVVGYGPDQACLRMEAGVRRPRARPRRARALLGERLRRSRAQQALRARQLGEARAQQGRLRARAPGRVRGQDARRGGAGARARLAQLAGARSAPSVRALAAGGPQPPWIEWYLAQAQDEYKEYVVEQQPAVRQVWQDYYDADLAIHPEWDSAAYKRRLMRVVLERMRAACAKRSVPFAALIVPSAVDLCPKNEIRVDPARYPSWDPARLTSTLAQILDELHVPCLNLYEPFRAGGAEGFYIGGGNMHWNARGQELAAREFARLLQARGIWPRTH